MSHLGETVKRIKRWFREGRKEEPTKIDIFFTERCNLKCRFCNYSKTPLEVSKKEMSDRRILRLIDEICEMDVKIFGVLGGEPFLRKKVLLESMQKIKKCGIAGSLVTNGTLIKEKDVRKIVEMAWDLIRFSVDGLRRTHDYLRGKTGSFDKVIKTIEMFYRTKRRLNSNFPTIEVNFVLTNRNYKELGPLIKKLSVYEVNFVYVLPLIELTEEGKKLKIDKGVLGVKKSLMKAEEESKELGVKTNIREVIEKKLFLFSNHMEKIILEDNKGLTPCFLPWYTININSYGVATPCAQWPGSEGIDLRSNSLKKVWFEDFEKMRDRVKHELPEWCSRCCVPLVDENKEIRRKLTKGKLWK